MYCMKCVGYDAEFQRALAENVASFVPPSQRDKPSRNAKKGKQPNTRVRNAAAASVDAGASNPRPKPKKKRKLQEVESSSSSEDEDMEDAKSDDSKEDDPDIEIIEHFMKRGTKSRPGRAVHGQER